MSKQLIRLKSIKLYNVVKTTLYNGDIGEVENIIGTYKVIVQELDDAVSATLYGADINKILRISSIHKILEILLKEKLNNSLDNISNYRIEYQNNKYKIVDVKSKYIHIERI